MSTAYLGPISSRLFKKTLLANTSASIKKKQQQENKCINKHGGFFQLGCCHILKKNLEREFSYLQISPLNGEIRNKASEASHILLHKYSGVKVESLIWVPLALIQPRPFNDVFNFKELNVTFSWETFFTIIVQQSNETIFPI